MNNKQLIHFIRNKAMNTDVSYTGKNTVKDYLNINEVNEVIKTNILDSTKKLGTEFGKILDEAEQKFCSKGGDKMAKKKKIKFKVWSKDEERRLLQYRKTMTYKQAARKLGRTVKAVDSKITQINNRKK